MAVEGHFKWSRPYLAKRRGAASHRKPAGGPLLLGEEREPPDRPKAAQSRSGGLIRPTDHHQTARPTHSLGERAKRPSM